MRISGNSSIDASIIASQPTIRPVASTESTEKVVKQGSETTQLKNRAPVESMIVPVVLDNSDETKKKVQEAVETMNEVLVANDSASRFHYHEGLDRYYVTVVDKNTEEVVKEIPPKKLLDAFYEMQKMVGMIVDEKI